MTAENRGEGLAVAHPTELILQDVRCFEGEQRASLRPITLLVGENSTGKTTLLGCYAALHRMFASALAIFFSDFNEEPFLMGSFRDIVSRRGPRGRVNEFKLGFRLEAQQSGLSCRGLTATFEESGSQPIVSSVRFAFRDSLYLELRRTESGGCAVEMPGCPVQEIDLGFAEASVLLHLIHEEDSLSLRRFPGLEPIVNRLNGLRTGDDERLIPSLAELVPAAPLRSRPKRTYDPVAGVNSPDGEHVPMLMMWLDRTSKEHWGSLHDDLVEFGHSAGLFSDIKVKRHGEQMGDPFQLQVKVRSGPHVNIMDVGYGISQSLPIVVDIMAANPLTNRPGQRSPEGRTFLLQQPEVHLHPRGQAQLALPCAKAS